MNLSEFDECIVCSGDYSYEDWDGNRYDYASYDACAESGDLYLDGVDNMLDVVVLVNQILNF